MNPPKDYFSILGIDPKADPQEIKRVFKELAFQYHPDRNPHNPHAEEKFKEVAEAYAYLSGNQELFQAIQSKTVSSQKMGEALSDIFDDIFGVDPDQWTPPGKDIYQMAELRLDEAYHGRTWNLVVWRELLCEACSGRGAEAQSKSPTCTYCFGRGSISVKQSGIPVDKLCPKCRGLGRIPRDPCRACRGRGVIPKKEKLKLQIPPKVRQGLQIRFPALGSLAARSARPGDLILQIAIVPHEFFTFDGAHLLCEVPVTFLEATSGASIQVPTLEGVARIEIPPGTRSGDLHRLQGLGLGGDLQVKVKVLPPVTAEERALLTGETEGGPAARPRKTLWAKIKRIFRAS